MKEKAAADKAAKEKAEAERKAKEKMDADTAAAEKAKAAEKAAADKAAKEKSEADKAAKALSEAESAAKAKAKADATVKVEPVPPIVLPMTENPSSGGLLKLTLDSIDVLSKKPSGELWDNGSDADLRISIKLRGAQLPTQSTTDKSAASFNTEFGQVSVGDEVAVVVKDEDVLFSDSVGTTTYKITEDDVKKGGFELKFDSVKSLKFRIAK